MVMQLIDEDIYIDVKLLSWSTGNSGGFSYERSTPDVVGVDNNGKSSFIISPNPASSLIQISGLENEETYSICNNLGETVKTGIITLNDKISISELNNGMYYLRIENRASQKFFKE